MRIYEHGDKPLVIAHRGGGNEYTENSVEAFTAMRELGFRHIETDAHVTKDGVAVLSHDPMIDRMTDGSGLIAQMTWDELSQYRDESGHRLLRVDETLAEFTDMIFNIDAKNDAVAAPLMRAIVQTGAIDRVCVASFNEKRLRRIRCRVPDTVTSIGVSAVARLVVAAHLRGRARSEMLRAVPGPERGAQVVQAPLFTKRIAVLTEDFVEAAHEKGLAVHAWTINDLEQVDILAGWGVDGIITDEPSTVREHLA